MRPFCISVVSPEFGDPIGCLTLGALDSRAGDENRRYIGRLPLGALGRVPKTLQICDCQVIDYQQP
jgi:hypothetical protein